MEGKWNYNSKSSRYAGRRVWRPLRVVRVPTIISPQLKLLYLLVMKGATYMDVWGKCWIANILKVNFFSLKLGKQLSQYIHSMHLRKIRICRIGSNSYTLGKFLLTLAFWRTVYCYWAWAPAGIRICYILHNEIDRRPTFFYLIIF